MSRRQAGRLAGACAVAAALWLAVSIPASARQRELPVFQVEGRDGQIVSSDQLASDVQWLMVYMSPACAACDRLTELLAASQSPAAAERTVVIVGGAPAAARAHAASRREIAATMRIYADLSMQAARALSLAGSPSIVAIRGGRIEWTLTGVLNDPDALASVIRTWVEY